MNRTLLYSISSYDYLARDMCRAGGFVEGSVEQTRFPDGERKLRIATACDGHDVLLVGGTVSDADTLELYDLACGLVQNGAARLSLIIPYFGYATMERSGREGEVVTAKARARLLSSVPAAGMGNRVFLLDLHVEGIAHYFESPVQPFHVSGKPLIARTIRRLVGSDDFVLGCTDAGRAKWVESLANELGVEAAFVYKRRLAGDRTEVSGVSAHVSGRRIVIYDDMIRTGSSLIGAAEAYRDAGATDICAVTTHGLFCNDALARFAQSGLLSRVVATDSHPSARAQTSSLLELESIAELLASQLGASG